MENEEFKIKKQVLRHEIKRYIEESIMNGSIKRGDKIIETKIARQLGVSQSPVREAIRELEIMGLVENQPYKGTIVKDLTPKDIYDAYIVRGYFEGLAAREAIKNITDEDIAELQEIVKKMDGDIKKRDYNEYIKHDIEFHEKILQISDNETLIMVSKVTNLSGWTYVTANFLQKNKPRIITEHAPIIKYLIARDADGAEAAMKQHIDGVYRNVMESLDADVEKEPAGAGARQKS